MDSDAKAAYQECLDTVTEALLARDTESFNERIILPHMIETMDGKMIYKSFEEVSEAVHGYLNELLSIGMNSFERVCDTARFVAKDTIIGYHTTRIGTVSDPQPPAYPTRSVLHRLEDTWRIGKMESAISESDWPDMPHTRMPRFRRSPDGNTSESEGACKSALQKLLDRTDAALMRGDFDTWRQAFALPLTFEFTGGGQVLTDEDHLRREFERYITEFSVHQVTDPVRVVKSASMIGDDQMIACYKAYLLHRGNNVIAPWESGLTLRRENGDWRITKIMRAQGRLNWSDKMHTPQPEPREAESIGIAPGLTKKTPN